MKILILKLAERFPDTDWGIEISGESLHKPKHKEKRCKHTALLYDRNTFEGRKVLPTEMDVPDEFHERFVAVQLTPKAHNGPKSPFIAISYHGEYKREGHAKRTCNFVKAIGEYIGKKRMPAIIGGDWNAVFSTSWTYEKKKNVFTLGAPQFTSAKPAYDGRPAFVPHFGLPQSMLPDALSCQRQLKDQIDFFCVLEPSMASGAVFFIYFFYLALQFIWASFESLLLLLPVPPCCT